MRIDSICNLVTDGLIVKYFNSQNNFVLQYGINLLKGGMRTGVGA